MKRIVTLTMNPSVDLNTRVRHVVADRKLRCKPLRREPGGGGVNVSRAICRLGGASVAFYTAGGPPGQMLQALLDLEGVKHRPIPIEEWTRENLMVGDESTHRQFRFNMPGPTLFQTEWQHCLDEVFNLDPGPEYIVASGSLPPGVPEDFYGQLAQRVLGFGGKLIVDTYGDPLRIASQAGVYLLKPNMNEVQSLIGRQIENELELEEAGRRLVENGQCEVIVISLGAGGALLVSRDGCEHVRAPTVPIKSKVGAGDSMVAGIVLSLATGKPLRDAVRFGVAAGAAAVMTPGTELCRREDAERLYQQIIKEPDEAR